jgi:pimeloyl-ACP methyl ester carboxylesterase
MRKLQRSSEMNHSRIHQALLFFSIGLISSCQSPRCISNQVSLSADDVIIATDSDAYYYDHCLHRRSNASSRADESSALGRKLEKLEKELATSEYNEVLLFVHGGMNTEKGGIASARAKFESLKNNPIPGTKVLPIFLTWDSGLLSSYWSHLIHEESGISYRDRRGVRTVNLAKGLLVDLPTDLAVGLVTTPRSLLTGMAKSLQNSDTIYQIAPNLLPTRQTFLRTLSTEFCSEDNTKGWSSYVNGFYCSAGNRKSYHVSLGRSRDHRLKENVLNITFSPAKAGFSPFYEALGTPGWHNMTRRTQTLVYRSPTLQTSSHTSHASMNRDHVADGVLASLLDRIGQWQKRDPHLKLTVAGHSMGTMVLNSGFRAISKSEVTSVRVDRMIYLAAACSIRDFQDTAGRYLREHPKTYFYNLCLNPFREIGEPQPLKKAPLFLSGSLLIWIDEFFEKPHDFLDRTLGTFENAIIAHNHLPKGDRFTLKAFGEQGAVGRRNAFDLGPQMHGSFGDYRFWEQPFLDAEKANTTVCYRHLKISN